MSERLIRVVAVAALLYVIASFISCGSMVTVKPHAAPSATGCEWGQKQCAKVNDCTLPDCAYTSDCSKRGRSRWPICIKARGQLCRTRRAVTQCGPGIGHDCYHPAGASNCEQLWAYEP